jgi:hypothetical protein
MAPAPKNDLTNLVLGFHAAPETITVRLREIHDGVLTQSRYLKSADFTSIHPLDLEFLFNAYDARFFSGLCRKALEGRRLTFHLSPRMTKAGGVTKRIRLRSGETRFEIAVASAMLFDGFGKGDRAVTVCGIECASRLEALQRIFEHELIHLAENLCWDTSKCSASRFQQIAGRVFLHRAHTHNLVTRWERAAASGIRRGSRVTFLFEGRRLAGQVNRITKRATVLVEDPEGPRYSDGRHYKTYYVPIAILELS